MMHFTSEEREIYEGQIKWFLMQFSTVKKYEQKGREEGIKIGEGIKEGIQIGEARGEKRKAIAKNLLKVGVSVDIISVSTGLSKKEIEEPLV